jgi:hypothetical protein
MVKKCQKRSKFCPLGTKNKRIFSVGMKTGDFILQGRKSKLAIKVGTENIFYLFYYYVLFYILDNSSESILLAQVTFPSHACKVLHAHIYDFNTSFCLITHPFVTNY